MFEARASPFTADTNRFIARAASFTARSTAFTRHCAAFTAPAAVLMNGGNAFIPRSNGCASPREQMHSP